MFCVVGEYLVKTVVYRKAGVMAEHCAYALLIPEANYLLCGFVVVCYMPTIPD